MPFAKIMGLKYSWQWWQKLIVYIILLIPLTRMCEFYNISLKLCKIIIFGFIIYMLVYYQYTQEMTNNTGLEKAKPHRIVNVIEYAPKAVAMKTILNKSTGNVTIMAFDSGQGLKENISPFDIFAQIIEGKAEIVIDKESFLIESGQGIIIPAHSPNFIRPNGRFKMTLTIIKSGYE